MPPASCCGCSEQQPCGAGSSGLALWVLALWFGVVRGAARRDGQGKNLVSSHRLLAQLKPFQCLMPEGKGLLRFGQIGAHILQQHLAKLGSPQWRQAPIGILPQQHSHFGVGGGGQYEGFHLLQPVLRVGVCSALATQAIHHLTVEAAALNSHNNSLGKIQSITDAFHSYRCERWPGPSHRPDPMCSPHPVAEDLPPAGHRFPGPPEE
jgi:hypothetical protein